MPPPAEPLAETEPVLPEGIDADGCPPLLPGRLAAPEGPDEDDGDPEGIDGEPEEELWELDGMDGMPEDELWELDGMEGMPEDELWELDGIDGAPDEDEDDEAEGMPWDWD